MSKKSVKMEKFRYKFASPGCAPLAGKEYRSVGCAKFPPSHASERAALLRRGRHPWRGSDVLRIRHPICLFGYHVTNYVLGSHPQKTYFSHSWTAYRGSKSPSRSTLFVLDRSDIWFMTVTLWFHSSDWVTVTTGCNICLSASSRRSALGIRYQCSTCEK